MVGKTDRGPGRGITALAQDQQSTVEVTKTRFFSFPFVVSPSKSSEQKPRDHPFITRLFGRAVREKLPTTQSQLVAMLKLLRREWSEVIVLDGGEGMREMSSLGIGWEQAEGVGPGPPRTDSSQPMRAQAWAAR
ncbi:unnamed protein product [Allacma fusca]|uniref:Uncharacterized protein n=1 Tax=Allacma fusca TaxID=39272 RepID=A0A8J2LGF3_9HEXA|nr:unnamed protein product [Allacma fusca]